MKIWSLMTFLCENIIVDEIYMKTFSLTIFWGKHLHDSSIRKIYNWRLLYEILSLMMTKDENFIDDFSILKVIRWWLFFAKKNHCWLIFYTNRLTLMTFLSSLMTFLPEKTLVDGFSMRKTNRWWLFCMKWPSFITFLYEKTTVEDFLIRKYYFWWLLSIWKNVVDDISIRKKSSSIIFLYERIIVGDFSKDIHKHCLFYNSTT